MKFSVFTVLIILYSPWMAIAAPYCRNCNVILISLDTVGARHLGLYGAADPSSPALDRFSQEASVYLNAIAPSSWTMPSHGALLTGYSPQSLGLFNGLDRIKKGVPTLATRLQAQNYKTAAIVNGGFLEKSYGYKSGFANYRSLEHSQDIFKEGTSWLKKNRASKFFLFLHTFQAHEPFHPTLQSIREITGAPSDDFNTVSIQEIVGLAAHKITWSQKKLDRVSKLYRAGILDIDKQLGDLFNELKVLGLSENTIVVVTSDHGEELGEHGYWGIHAHTVYDELLKIPLIIKTPGKPSAHIQSPVTLADIAPTILSYLGIEGGPPFSGQILPEIDTPASLERPVVSHTSVTLQGYIGFVSGEDTNSGVKNDFKYEPNIENWFIDPPRTVGQTSLRKGRYKLIFDYATGDSGLYDLVSDPGEKKNIAKSNPKAVRELQALMLQLY